MILGPSGAVFPAEENIFSLYFSQYFFLFNNADLHSYDRQSFVDAQASARENTDDEFRVFYANLRLQFLLHYANTQIYGDLSRSAHWGGDQFQGRDEGKNPINFHVLYFVYYPSPQWELTLGRHKYGIGNSYRDYFFSDTIDGVNIDYQVLPYLNFSAMADVISNTVSTEELGIYGIVSKDDNKVEDFRGDTISWRFGANFRLSIPEQSLPFFDVLGLRGFSYYLRYGANTDGGADLAENGRNSYNKSDGDDLSLSGIRLYASVGEGLLGFDITAAYAHGKDRQFSSVYTYDGYALALHMVTKTKVSASIYNQLSLSGAYFHPNFVSMKGASMGGSLLWGYKSYYSAPYAASYHFRDYAKREDGIQFLDRTTPKAFVKLEESLYFGDLRAKMLVLALWDSKDRAYMGTELELGLEYRLGNLKFLGSASAYFPTGYYQRHSLENTFIPSGKDVFYGMGFTVEYVLDLNHIISTNQSQAQEDRTQNYLEKQKDILD